MLFLFAFYTICEKNIKYILQIINNIWEIYCKYFKNMLFYMRGDFYESKKRKVYKDSWE